MVLGGRLLVIVLLLLDTGIRASEPCGLTLDNTHLQDGYVKGMGKGRKERIIPISANTQKALLRWINTWRPELADPDCDRLVVSDEGKPMNDDSLLHVIKRLAKRAGVPRLHPHLFRHTFAVKYLMNCGDVMTLKEILGHTTLDVTQVYMHLADVHIKIQHSRFSPVERLNLSLWKRRAK